MTLSEPEARGPEEHDEASRLMEETMPYLVAADLPTAPAGERFRALLGRPGILQLPGAHNGMAAKVAAAAKARRHLFIVARTDAAASEGIDGAVARAKRYIAAGADAIFPEALTTAEMFRAFAKAMPGVKLLANMTEFGQTPFFTAGEFEAMGYKMVIWPVSSLRVANKAQAGLYAALKHDAG